MQVQEAIEFDFECALQYDNRLSFGSIPTGFESESAPPPVFVDSPTISTVNSQCSLLKSGRAFVVFAIAILMFVVQH